MAPSGLYARLCHAFLVLVVLYLTFTNDLVAMATSLKKSENKVTIHHLHVKRFHMVKRL